MKRALLSVTNKAGITEFAAALVALGWEVVSTGGTAKVIAEAGVPVVYIEDVTRFPEMLDGRLKTLHPMVHGGILAIRSNQEHMEALKRHEIEPFDLVAVNLYNFRGKPSMEQIDIGGPTMLRSAAKNGLSVIVVVDPEDYDEVLTSLNESGDVSEANREDLVIKVFSHTARYDRAIHKWMALQQITKEPFLRTIGGH